MFSLYLWICQKSEGSQNHFLRKCHNFYLNLLLTHKSKTIGTIFVALWSNIFCEIGICCFTLLLKIRQKSEGSQNSTLEWSKVDLKVCNVSFGGVFRLKSIFGFSVPMMETLFLAWCFYDKCIYFCSFGYTEKGVSVARMKNPKPLSNRNTPPKLTFHTFRSTSDHS